ncbi:MAG: SH3 domain-containing protein, partial [Dehalococcoidia bacterium]|nr:SH3 domain-containing protein [Dehalococcoidia bacterium]
GDEAPTATITDAAAGETTPAKATTTAPAQVTIVATPAGQDATPPAPGSLSAGTKAVVAGTGECLNVRTAAGLGNDAIACIPDGTSVTLLGGPAEADQLTWWQIETPQGTGWAAADYLSVE